MSDEPDNPVRAEEAERKADAFPADAHAPHPLRDVLKLRRAVRVGVYTVITVDLPFYYFALGYTLAQVAAVGIIGWIIALVAVETAFRQMIKLRKRSAYPNVLLVEMGVVGDTALAAQRGLDVIVRLLGVRAALIGLRGRDGRLRLAACRGLSDSRADEILMRSRDAAEDAMAQLQPVRVKLAAGESFDEAFGLVPDGVNRIVFAPVISFQNAIGVIVLASDSRDADVNDDQLISGIGIALGLSLENLRQRDELRDGQERLERVVTGAPLVLFALDRDGAYTLVEGRGLEVLGTRPEQVLGRSIFDIFKGRTEITGAVKRALAGEEVIASADFSGAVFEARLTPLRDAGGAVAGVIGVAMDVTERRQAEDALHASQEQLSTMVANVPVVLFAIDRDGAFTLSEGKGLADLGLKAGQVVGLNVRDVYGDHPEITGNIERALGGEVVADTVEVNGLFWETIYSPVRDASGAVTGLIGVAANVTERRLADEALRDSEERYRGLVENASDIVFSRDLGGRFTAANGAAERILGYTREEILSMGMADIVAPEYVEMTQRMTATKLEQGGRTTYELEVTAKDGRRVPLEVSTWLAYEEGKAAVIHGIARDVSERRQSEETVQRRDAILEAVGFAAGRFLSDSDYREGMTDVLGRLGRTTGVSRVYVFENHTGESGELLTSQRFEWAGDGVVPQIDNPELQNLPYREAGFARWEEMLAAGQPVFGWIRDFPPCEREVLDPQDILSLAVVPIFVGGAWWGLIGFDDCVEERQWSPAEIEALRAAGQLIGAAIQRMHAEYAVRESEERYRELFDNASDIVYTHDLMGRFTSINEAAERITGYSREEAIGMNIAVIVAPDHLQHAVEMIRRKVQEGGETTYEIDIITKDGRRLPLEVSTRIILLDGKPSGVQGIARDIHARKRAEEALRESEEKYRDLVENASDGIFAVGIDDRFISVNAAIESMLGYSRDELCGMHVNEVIAPEHRELADAMTTQKVVGGGRTTYEIDVIRKDGARLPLEINSWLAFVDGKPVAIHGIARDVTARRWAEQALRESEERTRLVLENALDAIVAMDARGKVVDWNPQAKAVFGWSREEAIGRLLEELIIPEGQRGAHRRGLKRHFKSPGGAMLNRRVEVVALHKDGHEFPIELAISASPGPAGVVFNGFIRDITERRRAEQALRDSEEKYRDLVENSNEIIYTLDVSGTITYISPAVRQLGGYEPEEVVGKTSLSFVHPEDLPALAASFQRTIDGSPEPSEYRLRARSGEYVWVQTSSKPIYDGDSIVGLRGLIVDIDQRKRAEEALRDSEDRYRELFENASDLVYTHDLEGRYLSVNRAVEQITGYTPEEVLKLKWSDFVAEDQGQRLEELEKALYSGEGSKTFELDIITKDGRRVPLEVCPQLVHKDGQPVAIRGIARDIEERKRIDAALRAIVKGTAAEAGDEFFRSLVKHLAAVIGARYAFLGQLADQDKVAMLAVWTGEGFAENFQYELKGTPCDNVVDCEVCIYPRDVQSQFPDDVTLVEMGVQSYMGAPLFDSSGRPLGILAVMDDRPMEPSENLRSILSIFAARAGAELERSQAEEALLASEERYRNLVDTAQDVIYTLGLDASLTSLNPAFETVTGWKREDWLGKNFAPLVHPDDVNTGIDLFKRVLAGETPSYELRIRRPDGEYVVGEFTSTPLVKDGQTAGVFGIARDITERKKAEMTIRQLAYHDGLTGLPNRALFEDRLGVALAQAHRSRQMLAVMFLDLDRFKTVNDTLGHSGGDKLLKGVAEDLKTIIREGDTVARVGGDEFTLLLPGIESQDDAIEVAERMLDVLRGPRVIDGQEFSVTTSIGITLYPQDGADTDTLLRNADTAMYRAKESGRDNFQLFTPSMNAGVLQRLSLENDLRHALERNELRVYYQPISETATGRIVATEALVRWEHPQRGIVVPDEFIPFAEETGLIVPIGEWVLGEAMRQNQAWQEEGYRGLRVAVNMSARQLQQDDMVSAVSRLLRETGLAPELLQLEITEGAVMKSVELIIAMLQQIRRMGISISLDDFGTGYSSLSYLKRFPIDSVKIDRSFVRDIATDPNDAAIVTTVITMAGSLNLQVIAEGVETAEQLEFLRQRGCDQFQGYLVSPPAPADVITRLLEPARRTRAKITRLRSA